MYPPDDYPAMARIQLDDVGGARGDVKRFLARPLPPINTSSAQLPAGQGGAAAACAAPWKP